MPALFDVKADLHPASKQPSEPPDAQETSHASAELAAPAAGPRLAPIERPAGILHGLLCWLFKLRFGKVMTPLRVMFPRIPRYTFAHLALLLYFERGVSLPRTLRHLIMLRVSQRNGCSFCADAHEAFFRLERHPPELLAALADPLESGRFDGATAAALRYADQLCATGTADDATFDGLRTHFDEQQTMEIVWLVAFTGYLNAMARPLGLGSDGFCAIVQAQQTRAR